MSEPSPNERRYPSDAPTDDPPLRPNLVDVRIPPPARVPVFDLFYVPERDPFAPDPRAVGE